MPRDVDIVNAVAALDRYMRDRVVGQFLQGGGDAEFELYKQGGRDEFGYTIKMHSAKHSTADAAYWQLIGEHQSLKPNGYGLWCNFSAALTVFELSVLPAFGGRLSVVKQGDPRRSGHWFVVVDLDPATLAYPGPFNAESYTLDVWGALAAGLPSCLADPGACFFDAHGDNRLEVVCTIPAH